MSGRAAAYPNCNILNADINCDGAVNAFDIDPVVQCLTVGFGDINPFVALLTGP